ncbi:unnamed protein product [Pichia kudriavzevii]|uniref:Ubiquitin-like domain-containing protein n=1 Tax=Pichia kudriavzevii TaxID=4909 RepID=A0A099NYP7_PICKU|nr:hypothetical protein JL09_g3794 [Pichia kudriavzevii]
MPPKKSNEKPLILKAKRQSTTYMLDVSLKNTISQLKEKLVNMINTTGGLYVNNLPHKLDTDALHIPDNDIEIPQIGLKNSSDSENEEVKSRSVDDNGSVATRISGNSPVQITTEDITLAIFDDQNDIYHSKIRNLELDDSAKIAELNLHDFMCLAFKFKDEEFKIFQTVYE